MGRGAIPSPLFFLTALNQSVSIYHDMNTTTIKLTDNEWEILEHRLSQSDILDEVRHDDFLTGEFEEDRSVWDNADRLYNIISNRRVIDVSTLDDTDKWVLAECLNGCTFFGSIDHAVEYGDITKGKATALRKAGSSLEKKFIEAGIECNLCDW
jgi:hypothetical protein